MLAAHSEIATTNETWLLPLLLGICSDRVKMRANFSCSLALEALKELLTVVGEDVFFQAVNRLFCEICGLFVHNKRFFLEKTPRNYLVAREILKAFPDAKVIILVRNPLAVAASILRTWGRGRWNLYKYHEDLHESVDALVNLIDTPGILTITYEQLIRAPDMVLRNICKYLELDFEDSMLRKFHAVNLQGRMGDPYRNKYKSVIKEKTEEWVTNWNGPWRRIWARRYIKWLEQHQIKKLGYSGAELKSSLRGARGYKGLISDPIFMSLGVLVNYLGGWGFLRDYAMTTRLGRLLVTKRAKASSRIGNH